MIGRNESAVKLTKKIFRISHKSKRDIIFSVFATAITVIVFLLPTSFTANSHTMYENSVRVRAKVIAVDNSMVKIIGPVKQGEQQLEIQILTGKFKRQKFQTTNNLVGKIELDKLFANNDTILVVLDLSGKPSEPESRVIYANVIDHYRTDKTLILAGLFFAVLVLVTGWVGVKTFVSFIFSAVIIVKILLPAMLDGWDPILATLIVTAILTAMITFLVGGVSRKGLTAFIGAMGGVVVTSVFAGIFTDAFHIHGAVRPFAETLLYSGYAHLNLPRLFMSGVFLASSGAVMDLAMDISAGMAEVREQQPAIRRIGLIKCGFSMARCMTGTMTTTLLLAYSAEYTAMLMTFIAQGVPLENVINMVYVSSEVVHTLVGCFGLVLVAPLTAIAGGFIFGDGISVRKKTN